MVSDCVDSKRELDEADIRVARTNYVVIWTSNIWEVSQSDFEPIQNVQTNLRRWLSEAQLTPEFVVRNQVCSNIFTQIATDTNFCNMYTLEEMVLMGCKSIDSD